jgi:putative PIN family toxin of toxin-antitoxin system
MTSPALQIVVDTSVLVAGLRTRRGAAYKLLALLNDARWRVHVSVALVLEYEAVLKRLRDELQLSEQDVDDLVDGICAISDRHYIGFRRRPMSPDPDDDFLFDLAVVAKADCVITYNLHDLRALERIGVSVMTPLSFLQRAGVLP